jgi:hypothetical protein
MKRQRQQTEMGRAMHVLGSIRDCWLKDTPAGTWTYFGAVPAELCEWRKCHVASCHKLDENNVPVRMTGKVYQTREEGVDHLASLGYAIYNDGRIVKPLASLPTSEVA